MPAETAPALRARVRAAAIPIALALGRVGLTPNALTVLAFAGTCAAALAAAGQAWVLAGILLLAFGALDLLDGALARATNRATPFGAFLDSTLDRTGENLVYVGIVFGALEADFPGLALLAALALAMSSLVTYARARAESLGAAGAVGIAPRPERLVVLAGGLALAGLTGSPLPLVAGLALIAGASGITVIQRLVHVHRQLG